MTEAISHFHFIRPGLLLLAVPAALVWFGWRRVSDPLRGWRTQIDAELLGALTITGQGTGKFGGAGLLAAWLVAVVAIAGPAWRPEPSPFAEDATPLMILLEADASMDAPDPAPSRIERARLKIADLAEARPGQPLGLIAYAGSAHLVLPPTRDTAVVARMAGEIAPEIMPMPGDRLDLALRKAAEVMPGGGAMLVAADGVSVSVEALRDAAGERGLTVQFLSLAPPESDGAASIASAASALRAKIHALSIEDEDVRAIVRAAARAPHGVAGEGKTRWQEAGWYLTPLLALLAALSFRKQEQEVLV